MKQHSVPENIMDVEFKLFGSLSAKQFGYIIAGGCVALFFFYIFKALNSIFLGWIFGGLSVMLGLSLALIRINEQPFEVWLANFLTAMFSSQKRVWKKEKNVPEILDVKQAVTPASVPVSAPTTVASQGSSVPQVQLKPQQNVSSNKAPSSIPQHPFKDLSRVSQTQTSNGKKDNTVSKSNGVGALPVENYQIAGKAVGGDTQYIPGSAQKYVKVSNNQVPNRPLTFSQTQPAVRNQQLKHEPQQKIPKQPVISGKGEQDNPNMKNEANKDIVQNVQTPIQEPVNVVPKESIIQTQPAVEPKVTHVNKADKYGDVVPSKAETFQNVVRDPVLPVNQTTQAATSAQDLEEENKGLRQSIAGYSEEKSRLERDLSQTKEVYNKLQQQNEQMIEQFKDLKQKFELLQPKTTKGSDGLPFLKTRQSQSQGGGGVLSPKVYNGPSLTKKPNVVSGIVRTKEGKLLPGVVVIVKDEKARPVRAMKTNSLGQFITTTALQSGVYTIELSRNEYSFGRFEVNLTGDVLPTYEFVAG